MCVCSFPVWSSRERRSRTGSLLNVLVSDVKKTSLGKCVLTFESSLCGVHCFYVFLILTFEVGVCLIFFEVGVKRNAFFWFSEKRKKIG